MVIGSMLLCSPGILFVMQRNLGCQVFYFFMVKIGDVDERVAELVVMRLYSGIEDGILLLLLLFDWTLDDVWSNRGLVVRFQRCLFALSSPRGR